ncbi:MAG: hypothetical protein GY796_20830 [Chloroflexi bacterium]|nr:hypothetical protein [Chloroflexota bacterium]
MRKNIWFMMVGIMLGTTLLIAFIQGCTSQVATPTPRPAEEPDIAATMLVQLAMDFTREAEAASSAPDVPDMAATNLAQIVVDLTRAAEVASDTSDAPNMAATNLAQIATDLTREAETTGDPISVPSSTPTPQPEIPFPAIVRQLLEPFDQQVQEIDAQIASGSISPKTLAIVDCPYVSDLEYGECSIYQLGVGNMIFVSGYARLVNFYAYDLDGNDEVDVVKWDLDKDGQVDIVEYNIDDDEENDYAMADMDGNEQFGDEEIYYYQDARQRWLPIVLGALPFPVLPIFPY